MLMCLFQKKLTKHFVLRIYTNIYIYTYIYIYVYIYSADNVSVKLHSIQYDNNDNNSNDNKNHNDRNNSFVFGSFILFCSYLDFICLFQKRIMSPMHV